MSDTPMPGTELEPAPTAVVDHRREALVDGLAGSPMTLEELAAAFTTRFDVVVAIAHGELTVHASPVSIREIFMWARDDNEVKLRLLSDLSAVHWPAGDLVIERQPSTTGWPDYRVATDEGTIEVLYILRSMQRNHRVRVALSTPDDAAVLPSVVDIFPTANFHEREVYDMFGVVFEGHPDLRRILMPDDWVGHPHRKDYPLGGIDIPYENDKFIPPPNERDIREVVK